MSSPISVGPGSIGGEDSSRRRRAASLRRMSTRRRDATVASHARGSRGSCRGHARSASTTASCTASSAVAKSSPRRSRPASTVGASDRTRLGDLVGPPALQRHSMTSRTSIHSWSGPPPGPGSDDTKAATSSARSKLSTSIMYQPATRSLVSGWGASVTTGAASGPP